MIIARSGSLKTFEVIPPKDRDSYFINPVPPHTLSIMDHSRTRACTCIYNAPLACVVLNTWWLLPSCQKQQYNKSVAMRFPSTCNMSSLGVSEAMMRAYKKGWNDQTVPGDTFWEGCFIDSICRFKYLTPVWLTTIDPSFCGAQSNLECREAPEPPALS